MQYNSNRKSVINNDVVIEKDIDNNNDVVIENDVNDVNENDVVVEKVVNNDDYDYSNNYWDSVRNTICREREEERRLKYLRKPYNKQEVAKLKAIIDNKKNDDDFDFDNWVFDEFGKQVDIVENAKKDLWDLYGIKYNGIVLNLKKFNGFMKRMDGLYCDLHGGLKQDCVECNK